MLKPIQNAQECAIRLVLSFSSLQGGKNRVIGPSDEVSEALGFIGGCGLWFESEMLFDG